MDTYLKRQRRSLALALTFGILGTHAFTYGQSDQDDDEEEIFELSPFEVTGEEDQGYRATSTLAGTRIRTDLKDVGSAISVYTEEFLDDLGATDNGSLLQYTTNAEVGGMQSTYAGLGNGAILDESSALINPTSNNRIRGLSAAENTRDYFVTDIPWDGYNVNRIDIQRGANSFLFGLGSPAGIINATLADAVYQDEGEAQVRVGSYGSLRGSVSVNKVLIGDSLAVRVAGLWDHQKYQQDEAFEDDERIYGTVRWQPDIGDDSMSTTLKAKFEHGKIDANRPRTVTPVDSISPWFRPMEVDAQTNPFGGMGKVLVDNPYDAFSDYQSASGDNYIPWMTGANLNAQHPYWLFDGNTGQVLDARAGWVNSGARGTDGSVLGAATGLPGKRFSSAFLGIGSLNNVATNLNLPLAQYGQYRAQSMSDASIFDFYNTLIDGPTKSEFEEWDSYNVEASQTWFNDRIGIQLIYDKQDYTRGGEALLGWQPSIQVDMLQNWDDLTPNPNVGRPFVMTGGGGGSGRSYESDRQYVRGSAFAEMRAEDFMDQDSVLTKLLGKHLFNAVYSEEDYQTENLSWQRHAAEQDWYAFWNQNEGNTVAIQERAPTGIIYLGDSVTGLSTSSGANIPGISAPVDLSSGSVFLFDSRWDAPSSVAFDAPWTVPDSLAGAVFNVEDPPEDGYRQNSNPDNYIGWTDYPIDLLSYNMGEDNRLLRQAQRSQREVSSLAATWQAFLWDGAVVGTLGWREDEVKSRGVTAPEIPTNRNILDLSPSAYSLPAQYADNRILKDDSTSYSVVVHLNQLFNDALPLNVSLSYSDSSNFQVTDVRNDLYGNPIANPSGSTKDYGVTLTTKDGRYSFRAIKYESEVNLASASLENAGNLGGAVANGMNWRNVFLYDLALYDWNSRGQGVGTDSGYRNTITNAYPEIDPNYDPNDPDSEPDPMAPEAYAFEDEMITTWNNVQAWLTDRNFFEAWGFTPQALSSLTDRSTFEANPDQWTPSDTSLVYTYSATAPQNFSVTSDTLSEGYEYEFTANPTDNWRISFNASETEAFRNNVGGELINEFMAFMDEQLLDPSNTDGVAPGFTPAGAMPRWGNPGGAIGPSIYSPFRADYTRMKLQEGTAVPELRKWRYNVVTNYSFNDGKFSGLGVGGSYRWQDKIAIGYPLVEDPENPGQFTFDVDDPIYGPSEDSIDLWASYERPINDKVDWRIQLNIRNAFADEELLPVSVQPDNETYAGLRIAPVQEWFITNTFTF